MNGYAVISDLNASYALRASALSSGFPLKRKSGFRNAAPPYFHFIMLQRHNVVICSLTVRSHTPVCFDKSALFVRILPPSSVIETRVKRSRKAAFKSLKFLTAVISNVLPPFPKARSFPRLRGRFSCPSFFVLALNDVVQTSRRSAAPWGGRSDFELYATSPIRFAPVPAAPPAPAFRRKKFHFGRFPFTEICLHKILQYGFAVFSRARFRGFSSCFF